MNVFTKLVNYFGSDLLHKINVMLVDFETSINLYPAKLLHLTISHTYWPGIREFPNDLYQKLECFYKDIM